MQRGPMRRKAIICLTFTSPPTPQLWRHSFARDSMFLKMRPCSISLPSVKQIRTVEGNFGVQLLIEGASDVFSQNQWAHLACHGMPNRKQPFESSFAMRDGSFTIKDIIPSRLQNPEFAFLSTCHTTVGDESSPEEAIHLAAAMQFSGFCSVIGSMWSVDDEVARQVVAAFYDNLVDSSGRLDCRRAAVALHNAVKTLREKILLEQQIVFVHIGV
ncbi:CHAT domain-containing protein [Suillus lakei]|nr:CHAT domain-containing protein [Suillus lakei]